MSTQLKVKPLGSIAKIADYLMTPVMHLVGGTRFREKAQRTHVWNNTKLTAAQTSTLSEDLMVHLYGIPSKDLSGIGRHLTIFGGWRPYAVVKRADGSRPWHVGWITPSVSGVSRVELTTPCRVLIGPTNVYFFGIDAETGVQIQVILEGRGLIGKPERYRKLPLL